MSKRFGRNQKRRLQQQMADVQREGLLDASKWRRYYQAKALELDDLRSKVSGRIDLGLYLRHERSSVYPGDFRVTASIMDNHSCQVITAKQVYSARDKRDLINYTAHHIASQLIHFLGDKIHYE